MSGLFQNISSTNFNYPNRELFYIRSIIFQSTNLDYFDQPAKCDCDRSQSDRLVFPNFGRTSINSALLILTWLQQRKCKIDERQATAKEMYSNSYI